VFDSQIILTQCNIC